MKVLAFIGDIFRKYPLLLIVTTLLVVLVSVIEACSLFAVGPLVDFLIQKNQQVVSPLTRQIIRIMEAFGVPSKLSSYLIIFGIFIVLGSSLRVIMRHSILRAKYAVLRDLVIRTFDDFFHARWYFFSSSKQGVLLNTFMRELNIVGDAFGAMANFFAGIIQLVFYLAIPFYLSWQVTVISLITAFLLSCPFILIGKISYRLGRLSTSTGNQIASVIQESFTLAKVVLGFANQKKSVDNLSTTFDIHRKATLKFQTIANAIPILYRPLGTIVLIVALFSAQRFGLPVPEMAVLLLALLQVVLTIGKLTTAKNSLDNFFPSYEQVNKLRNKAKEFKQVTGEKLFTGISKKIVIEKVSFGYPDHEATLEEVSVKIPKGRMVAIVGESGAGKSTLIDMIMGFNEPDIGRITFDGVDLQKFDINSYRKRIGYVPQDSILFNMSIRDNLLWAMKDATDEDIKQACQQANADEFIQGFSHGYDTIVGDRGIRLSGGQRQRISLARAILRKPDLLFLDEATSSLDTRSERLIQQAIEDIAKKTTIIVIAHRLSTIVNADYVYVLKEGKVVEEGTYSDLIEMDGYFNRMVKLQLLETVEETE